MSENAINGKKQRLSIFVIGYDGYSDLWDTFMYLFNKHWGDCAYDTFFINNTKNIDYKNVKVIHAGREAEWSLKVKKGLENSKSEYVCLLLEDFFISKNINNHDLEHALDIMDETHADYLKLVDLNTIIRPPRKKLKINKRIHYSKECDEYGVSLQPSIWKRDFLLQKLGSGNYNAWIFESRRCEETKPGNREYRKTVLFDTRNILHIKHGVLRGRFIPSTYDFLRKNHALLNTDRMVFKRSQYFKILFRSFLRDLLPPRFKKKTKDRLKKSGYHFMDTKSK